LPAEILTPSPSLPLGMIEWDSVAYGIRSADAALKAAPVFPVALRAVTPGRYVAVFTGDVDSVSTSVRAGVEAGGSSVVDRLVLPQPHPGLRPALGARTGVRELSALGVLETLSLSSLVGAADAAAKAGEIRLHEMRLAMGLGGKAFALFSGEISQVEAALAAGADFAAARRMLLAAVSVPNPDALTLDFLRDPASPFADFAF
jgi:microcompartment protein CcmL/EutN